MKHIRNLLFDLDGTLVDSSQTIRICIDYALDQAGITSAAGRKVESVIGKPLFDIFVSQYDMSPDQAESAIGHYRAHYHRLAQAGSRIYDGIHDALSILRNDGLRLFIATVKPTSVADKVLCDLQLRPYFDGVAGATMGTGRRDKTSIIAFALKKFDLDPRCSMMIGDRDQDILGARENGMSCIAVSYGFGSKEELDSALPDHVVGHSREIVSLFTNPSLAKKSN